MKNNVAHLDLAATCLKKVRTGNKKAGKVGVLKRNSWKNMLQLITLTSKMSVV